MALILGGFVFEDMELPSEIPFFGPERIYIHQLLGGRRVIDVMGNNPDPIEWSGYFLGSTAPSRVRALEAMKEAGQEVSLIFGSFAFQVVIKDFKPKYQREYQIAYTICCEVSEVETGVLLPSLGDLVFGDFSALTGLSVALGTAIAGTAAGSLISALTADPASILPDGVVSAAVDAATAIQGVATGAATGQLADVGLTGLQPAVAAAETAYDVLDASMQATDSGDLVGIDLDAITGASTLDGLATFANEQAGAAALADLVTARGYMGRIVANLTLAGG